MIQSIKLDLGGQERHFTFGITFLGEVSERFEPLGLEEVILKAIKHPAKYTPLLMFESLKNTYFKERKDLDFVEQDIIDWLELEPSYGADKINKFLEIFLATNENKVPVEEVVNKDDKKQKKK